MKLTAHILALYFLLGSLLPGSDFSQLKKAPAVLEHYLLHQQLEDAGSFFDFLYDHFWNPRGHQHEDGGKSHQELPLKTVQIFSPLLPADHAVPELASLPVYRSPSILHYLSFTGAAHEGAIFRPPILSRLFSVPPSI